MEAPRVGCLTPRPCQVRQPHHRDLAVGLDDGRAVSGTLHRSAPFLRRGECNTLH